MRGGQCIKISEKYVFLEIEREDGKSLLLTALTLNLDLRDRLIDHRSESFLLKQRFQKGQLNGNQRTCQLRCQSVSRTAIELQLETRDFGHEKC